MYPTPLQIFLHTHTEDLWLHYLPHWQPQIQSSLGLAQQMEILSQTRQRGRKQRADSERKREMGKEESMVRSERSEMEEVVGDTDGENRAGRQWWRIRERVVKRRCSFWGEDDTCAFMTCMLNAKNTSYVLNHLGTSLSGFQIPVCGTDQNVTINNWTLTFNAR